MEGVSFLGGKSGGEMHVNARPNGRSNSQHCLALRGLVSEETVMLRWWGSDTRKFGLSTELIM